MRIDKSLKVGVLSSLVASIIFLYVLEPVLNFLSRTFIFLSEKFSTYFIDRLYQEIAFGRSDYALTIITLVNFFFLTIIIVSSVGLSFMNRVFIQKSKEDNPESHIELRREFLNNIIRRVRYFTNISVILVTIIMLSTVVASHIKYSSIMTFEQYLKIVTPYISQHEKDMLVSKFASMRTYKNYEEIINEISICAKKHKIALPEQIYFYTY